MKELRAYLSEGTKNNFALEVNGKWGSGKTYFITNFIEEHPKVVSCFKRVIYVSLNGIGKYSEIQNQILASMMGQDNKKGRVLVGLVRTAASLFIRNNDNYNGSENDIKIKLDDVIPLENILFIFDDLERISPSIRIDNLLGYISRTYLSNDSNKSIYLCDETNIADKELFKLNKEKYIGWTLSFKQNNNDVIKSILKKYNFYTKQNFTSTLEICKSVKFNNYRSLIFALDTFSAINRLLPKSKYAFNSFLFSVLVISKEFKLAKLEVSDYSISFPPSLDVEKFKKIKGEKEKIINENTLYFRNNHLRVEKIQAALILEAYFVRLVTSFDYDEDLIKQQLIDSVKSIANKFKSKVYRILKTIHPFYHVDADDYKVVLDKILAQLNDNKLDVFDTMEVLLHLNFILGFDQKYLAIDLKKVEKIIEKISQDSYMLWTLEYEHRYYKYPLNSFLNGTIRINQKIRNKFIKFFEQYQELGGNDTDNEKKVKDLYKILIENNSRRSIYKLNFPQGSVTKQLFLTYCKDIKFNRLLLAFLEDIDARMEQDVIESHQLILYSNISKYIETFYSTKEKDLKFNELYLRDRIREIQSRLTK